MRNIRLISVLCILVMGVLSLTGCTTFNNFKEAFIDEPADHTQDISIGVFEPMTGADKDAAASEVAGIELAHDMIPEAGGHRIQLIYADNSSDIDAAETSINTLLSKKPDVILGSYGEIYSLVAGEYIAEAQVPAITITNINPLITRNNGYYFRVCYIEATQGRLLAQYLDSTKEKKTGILLPEKDDAATAMATAFANEFKDLTGDDDAIAFYEKYTTGDTDYSKQLKDLQKSEVKSVLLPGEMIDAANIIKEANRLGLDVTFLGTTNWGSEEFLTALSSGDNEQSAAGVDPQKLAFVQFFSTDGKTDTAMANASRDVFLEAFHKKYGTDQEPDEAMALGYDAYALAIDAVLKASGADGSLPDGEAIRSVLMEKNYEYDGASGVIRFNKKGDPKKTAYISTWEEGAIKTIYTIEADEQ